MRIFILFLFLIGSFSSFAQLTQKNKEEICDEVPSIIEENQFDFLNEYYKIKLCDCSNLSNDSIVYFYTFYDSRIVYSEDEREYPKHRIFIINRKENTYSKYSDLEMIKSKYPYIDRLSILEKMSSLPKQTLDLEFTIWMYLHPRYHFLKYCKNGVEKIKYFNEAIDLGYSGGKGKPKNFDKNVKRLEEIKSFIQFFDNL